MKALQLISSKTKYIMLISGVLTCTMLYALIFPQAALMSMFGQSLSTGVLAGIVVRSWGALITLIGAMLIYGAFHPVHRALILWVAGSSKLCFVILLVLFGGQFLPNTIMPIVIDSLTVVLFIICYLSLHIERWQN
ncbi:MAG: hypothetical protein V7785_03850 [Bermanella sp.]